MKLKSKKLSLTLIWLLSLAPSCLLAQAQKPPETVQTANTIGFGGSLIYDSNLSNLSYGGWNINYLYDRLQRLKPGDDSWLSHFQGGLSFSIANNPSGNASYYGALGDISWGALWHAAGVQGVNFYIGPGVGIQLGGLYSSRNGNNPASLKASLTADLQVLASYRLPLESFPALFVLSWQTSLLGSTFAPGYGESYYELFTFHGGVLKGFFRHQAFAYPGNFNRQHLSVSTDIPLHNFATLRLGYSWRSLYSNLNGLRSSWHNHSTTIGFVLELQSKKGRKAMRGETVKPVF